MKKIDACKLRRKGGFTLVELIVVLVLLSILSAVAVPTYLGFVDDNKAKQCETHRKALASRLEEMSAMGSDVELTDAMINGDENGCPAGGTYTLTGTADESDINSKTITCSIEEHGSTTVMLRNNSQVTAKSNTQTEGKVENEPAPVILSVSISPNPLSDMEIGEDVKSLSANPVSQNCSGISYIWSVENGNNVIHIEGASNSKTINIKADHAGTSTICCQATATSDVDHTVVTSEPATVNVTVNPVVPTLSYSVNPASVEMEVEGEEKTLNVVNLQSTYCTVNDYNWTSDSESIVRVTGNGKTATLKPLAEGTCTIHCQASDIAVDSDAGDNRPQDNGADVQVTVNKKKELSVTVSPGQMSLEPYAGGILEANVTATGYNSYNCVWTVNRETVASVERTADDQKKANVTGLEEGTAIVTCTVTPDNDVSAAQTATATVTVKEKESATNDVKRLQEKLIPDNESHWCEYLTELQKQGIIPPGGNWNFKDYNIERGGGWGDNNWPIIIKDEAHELNETNGNSYELEYTVQENGVEKKYIVPIRVVYPSASFETNPVNEGKIGVPLDGEVELGVMYRGKYTTDKVTWSNNAGSIADMEIQERRITQGDYVLDTVKITGKNLGTSEASGITATIYKEYSNEYLTKTWQIDVYEEGQINQIGVFESPMQLKKGETKEVGFWYNPQGASLTGVEFRFSRYGDYLTVDQTNRKITGEKYGKVNVKMEAVKNNKVLADCNFDVIISPFTNMYLDHDSVTLLPNENATVKLMCEPGDWSTYTNDVEFRIDGDIPSFCEIVQNGTEFAITGKSSGKADLKIQALAEGDVVREAVLHIEVVKVKKMWTDPESSTIQREKTATVTIGYEPSDATGLTFEISDYDPRIVDIKQNEASSFTLTGKNPGSHWLTAKIKADDGSILEQKFQVTVTDEQSSSNSQVQISGSNYPITQWEDLRSAIKNGTVEESMPLSNLYSVDNGNGNIVVYFRRKTANLIWDNSCSDDMSFQEYLQSHSNDFISLNFNHIIGLPPTYGYSEGQLVKTADGKLYICVEGFDWSVSQAWKEDDMAKYFVEIPKI